MFDDKLAQQRWLELWGKKCKRLSHHGIGHWRSESGRTLELGPQTPGDPGAGAKAHPKGGREPHKGASPPTRAAPQGATPAGRPGGQSPQGGPTTGQGEAAHRQPPTGPGRARPRRPRPEKEQKGRGATKEKQQSKKHPSHCQQRRLSTNTLRTTATFSKVVSSK